MESQTQISRRECFKYLGSGLVGIALGILGANIDLSLKEKKISSTIDVEKQAYDTKPVSKRKIEQIAKNSPLVGKWKANGMNIKGNDISDLESAITFNENGTYEKTVGGCNEKGNYVFSENEYGKTILFYKSKEELEAFKIGAGRFDEEYFKLKGNNLTLTNTLMPSETQYSR